MPSVSLNFVSMSLRSFTAVVAVIVAGCDTTAPGPTPPAQSNSQTTSTARARDEYQPPSTENYVGTEACATCHETIAESFAAHPMARSIRLTPEVEVQDVGHRRVDGRDRFLTVSYDDSGAMFHNETMVDTAGDVIFEQKFPMDFVVGSGQRAYAYLRKEGDLLFQSPLNWYAQKGSWDLSPGYHKDDARRFRRRVTDDCLACHSGRVNSSGRSLNRYQTPVFHQMSIGCENCHGPGRDHVSFHNGAGNLSDVASATDSIVNPVKLPKNERDSVCNQCHLEATARVLRYGRSSFDFRPGQKLEEIWTVLDAGVDITRGGKARAVNHVQQMRSSGCYIGTGGELGCISCHDPHVSPSPAQRDAFYRTRCLNCHETQTCSAPMTRRTEKNDSCVACHMPYRDSNNISHVTQTDHRVLRMPVEELDDDSDADSSEIQLLFFDDANKRLSEWESKRATSFGVWQLLDKKGQSKPASLSDYLKPVLISQPNDGVTLSLLGMIAAEQGRRPDAINYYEKARATPASEETAVSGLLTAYYLDSNWTEALSCADRMIQLDPGAARYHAMRADILSQLGRLDDGIASAERAVELNPTMIPVREWLVDALFRSGRRSESASARLRLDRIKSATTKQ